MRHETYFTSDTHFGHRNIIRYCGRPFNSSDHMDAELIRRWNEVVGDDDVIYHLGDFTLAGHAFARRILAQLKGRIRVLGYPWHHDARWLPTSSGPSELYSRSGHPVEILAPVVVERLETPWRRRQQLVLCHYPFAQWDGRHHGAWHLHGHSHGTHPPDGAMLDVGVDCHDFRPVTIDQLCAHFNAQDERLAEVRA